jgi:hypothetical protein
MPTISITKCLTEFFNTGDGKRASKEWLAELKELSTEEKQELAQGVCAITGNTLA